MFQLFRLYIIYVKREMILTRMFVRYLFALILSSSHHIYPCSTA